MLYTLIYINLVLKIVEIYAKISVISVILKPFIPHDSSLIKIQLLRRIYHLQVIFLYSSHLSQDKNVLYHPIPHKLQQLIQLLVQWILDMVWTLSGQTVYADKLFVKIKQFNAVKQLKDISYTNIQARRIDEGIHKIGGLSTDLGISFLATFLFTSYNITISQEGSYLLACCIQPVIGCHSTLILLRP